MIPREPENQDYNESEIEENPTPESSQDVDKVLSEAQQKAQDYLDSWKRAQADFINYKRRTEQENLGMGKYANTQLILSLLPILDDFDRAFDLVAPQSEKADWLEGIKLIGRKLKSILEAQGVSPIKAVGEPFDPNLHEAVMHIKGEEGKVIRELLKGYKLYDKVIRPSHVAVGNGEPVEEETDE